MSPRSKVDILLVFQPTTLGLRVVHGQLRENLISLGLRVASAAAGAGRASALKVGYPVIDLIEAAALRSATMDALHRVEPKAIMFETPSALLLEPLGQLGRVAVRFDAPAEMNRPGWRNAWQRRRQRRAFSRVRLLLPATSGAHAWAEMTFPGKEMLPLFSPIAARPVSPASRRKAVTFYAGDPAKKGLDIAVKAWNMANLPGYTLEVIGIERGDGLAFLASRQLEPKGPITWRGRVSPTSFRDLCGSAEIHLATPRFDEYAAAQLEAMSDGAVLVTGTPVRGPYEPLLIANQLSPELVAPSTDPTLVGLALCRAAAMSEPERRVYRTGAERLLAPYREAAFRGRLADEVLPRLLSGDR